MKRSWSIRMHLLMLVGCIAIPFIGLLTHSVLQDIKDDTHKANETVFSLADLIAVHIQRFMRDSEIVLSRLAQRPVIQTMDHKYLKSIFNDIMNLQPYSTNVLLVDKNGSLIDSASPINDTEKINLFRSSWFRSTMDQAKFSVGSVSWDPFSKKHYCILAYPVLKKNEIVGVLGIAIDLMHFQKIFLNLTLPAQATITISDPEGIIVSRSLDPENWIGKNANSTEINDIVLSRAMGHVEARGIDGEKRIYGFTTVPICGWRVYSGIPSHIAYEVSHAVAFQNTIMALIITGLVTLLGIYFSRKIESPILHLAQATSDATRGSMEARLIVQGPREIIEVSKQFNEMLDARVSVENDLNYANERLKTLSHRLFQAQETERRAIARELHDEIGQALTAIKINLQAVERFPDTNNLEKRLEDSVKIVERTLQQVRNLSLDLRPQLLDDLGLVSALRWYVQEQAQRSNLRMQFLSDSFTTRLDPSIETACFRVAQEAITNVIRYAKAHLVTIELRLMNNEVHLFVRDNGEGFDTLKVREGAGRLKMGLCGMEERVRLVGGKVIVTSKLHQGTEVHAWFLLSKADPSNS